MPSKTTQKTRKRTTKSTDTKANEAKGNNEPRWCDSYYVRAYDLARAGASDLGIAADLGVSTINFMLWQKNKPALREAVNRGRSLATIPNGDYTLKEYVYLRLPPDIQTLWNEVVRIQREKLPLSDAQALLQNLPEIAAQRLYVHALCATCFNVSKVCRILCISYERVQNWIKNDPNFCQVIEEIDWHKGNFFEASLCRAVARGETQAIIFANKTYNRLRGYADMDRTPLDTGDREEGFRLSDLDLPVELLERIEEAVRKRQPRKLVDARAL